MKALFSLLVGKANKPVVTDDQHHIIPMPKGFTSGYLRMTDDNRLVAEADGEKPLVWNSAHRKWYPYVDATHDCRTCGMCVTMGCPLGVSGCPMNEAEKSGD